MRTLTAAASVLALTSGLAVAGGIDRSGQNIGIMFEPGRVVEFSFGRIDPSVSGTDLPLGPLPGGGDTGNVGNAYNLFALSYKYDINEKVSFAMIADQPFGADILYGPGSVNLGGTLADAKTVALTGLFRYKMSGGWSMHGGLRAQQAQGDIGLSGWAYGPPAGNPLGLPASPLNGYAVSLDNDWALGYVVGAAYEKPEIAMRIALTYNSKITHSMPTTETVRGAVVATGETTDVSTPESVNLDFQTGIAKDTLLFGQVRWANWSQFQVSPSFFDAVVAGSNSSLVDIDDTTTWTLGIGRRFTPVWSGSISFTYEKEGDPLVSPLSPTNGRTGVTLAAIYTKDKVKVTTGVSYVALGDAQAETGTPDVARADFTDNYAVGFGMRVAYTF
jgi:long-chain fatty acid transport protein